MKRITKILISFMWLTTLITNMFVASTTAQESWFSAWTWRWIWVVWVWTNDEWGNDEPKALTIIRTTINRILWLLGVIALVFCLRWGFQMLTAAWDDSKVKSWIKVLKNAAIWLVVIWLSWIIVRFVFRIITTMSDNSWW